MSAKVPKVFSPDLETPSGELRKEAYELAFSLWEMAPWIDFIEEQVLAIRFADGAERFLSVMGRNGEHRAIALYPDAATYWRIRGIESGDSDDVMDAFMSTNQLQLFFCKAQELLRGERAAIKASGVKFPRGVNPSFVSYIAGFVPDAMGTGEIRETGWTPIVESVLKNVSKLRFRPEMFATTSRQMEAVLKSLCQTDFKGSEVSEHSSCACVKTVFADFSSRLFGR